MAPVLRISIGAMVQGVVEHFTYLGIFLVLFVAGMGLPIPEEVPIVAAAALSHEGVTRWWLALPVCIVGVLSGDIVLYWAGRHFGERVLRSRLVRRILTPEREEQLKAAYCRHAIKTILTVRHMMGLRAAAFLTAGIARVPFLKFMLTDAFAAAIGVPVSFGLAYFFTDRLEELLPRVRRIQRLVVLALVLLIVVAVALVAWWRKSRRTLEPGPASPGRQARPLPLPPRSALGAPHTLAKVRDVMVRDAVTIAPSATLLDAARQMRDADVSVLAIVEGGRVTSVVTDRDLAARALARPLDPSTARVADCGAGEPVCARPEWSVEEAITTMLKEQVTHLPVVDDRDHVIGTITLSALTASIVGDPERRISRRVAGG